MKRMYIHLNKKLVITEDLFKGKLNGFTDCHRLRKDLTFGPRKYSMHCDLHTAKDKIEKESGITGWVYVEFKNQKADMNIAFKALMDNIQPRVGPKKLSLIL